MSPGRRPPRAAVPVARRLGENVRRLREERGFSQEDLGLRAELHRTHIGFIERGESICGADVLVKLAGALDVSARDLLTGIRWNPVRWQPGGLAPSSEPGPPMRKRRA